MENSTIELNCQCGQVAFEVLDKPIISAECLCSDCQKAGLFLQTLTGAPSILNSNGGTRFELYRKDKVQFKKGQANLREHLLTEKTSTRRVIASCCNTPIFLDFTDGHWLSIYGVLWPAETLPPLEIRTMTRSRPEGVELPNDVPNPKTHTLTFYRKLFAAWVAMRFRTPKVDFVSGRIGD